MRVGRKEKGDPEVKRVRSKSGREDNHTRLRIIKVSERSIKQSCVVHPSKEKLGQKRKFSQNNLTFRLFWDC